MWSEVVPQLQGRIASILDLPASEQLVFAPNTHEFVNRLLSCFEERHAVRILTTDSEFHSFRRQVTRLQEAGWADVVFVPSDPIEDFAARFTNAAKMGEFDLIFLSQVFFSSGLVVEKLLLLCQELPAEPMFVVDGYHAFCALPTSLGAIADRIFYLAGGYKYAQAGEGVCFMSVPRGCRARPLNTGWFADFAGLEAEHSEQVMYSNDGMRFAGATFDLSGVYRMNAVLGLFENEGIKIEHVHRYVQKLQSRFLGRLDETGHPLICRQYLQYSAERNHSHFFTFVFPSVAATKALAEQLETAGVIVDYRGNRLRFGFGLYQDENDVDELFRRL